MKKRFKLTIFIAVDDAAVGDGARGREDMRDAVKDALTDIIDGSPDGDIFYGAELGDILAESV